MQNACHEQEAVSSLIKWSAMIGEDLIYSFIYSFIYLFIYLTNSPKGR